MFWLSWKLILFAGAAVAGVAAAWHRRSLRKEEASLAQNLEELGSLVPGGRPENPLVVPSAAVVEARARDQACLACDVRGLDVDHHRVETIDGERLRVLRMCCPACGTGREVYVRIAAAGASAGRAG